MNIDLCITYWNNMPCLRACAKAWAKTLIHVAKVRVLIHSHDPHEDKDAVEAFTRFGFDCRVVSHFNAPDDPASGWINRLFTASTSPWIIMTEHDFFPCIAIDPLVERLAEGDFVAAGPLDTLFHDNLNALKMKKYGQYARLSPEPGYFHSSLILLNREFFLTRSSTPFSLPAGYRLHGYGCLGGEPYYGLRLHVGNDTQKLVFFRQVHSSYGYSADIYSGQTKLGTHLYYGSRHNLAHPMFDPDEKEWIIKEQERFINDHS